MMGIKMKKARSKASIMWSIMDKKGLNESLSNLYDDLEAEN